MAEVWCVLMLVFFFFSPVCRTSRLLACRWLCSTSSLWCHTSSLTSPFFSNLLFHLPSKKQQKKNSMDSSSLLRLCVFLFRVELHEFNNLTFSLILSFISLYFIIYLCLCLAGNMLIMDCIDLDREKVYVCVCVCAAHIFWCREVMFVVQKHWSWGPSVWLPLKSTVRMFDEVCLK